MTLSVASPFTIDTNGVEAIAIARINSTQSIVLYQDSVAVDIEARVVEVDEDIGTAETIETAASSAVDSADVCVLSGTKAIVAVVDISAAQLQISVVTISGTSLTFEAASTINVTNSSDSSANVQVVTLSTSAFLLVHDDSNVAYATYFTVSGLTITEQSQTTFDGAIGNASLISLSSSIKALVAYIDVDDSSILKMCVLSISGSTVSAGTPVNIEASDTGGDVSLAPINSSTALLSYANVTDKILKAVIISVSGTVPSVNTAVSVDTWTATEINDLALIDFSTTQFGLCYDDNIAELGVSGTNVSDNGTISLTTDSSIGTKAVMFTTSKGIAVYQGTAKGVIVTASPISVDELDIAPMRKPADIDADGTYVYLAALNNSGNPVLVKILGDLSADGSLVFNPGAGSNIGVECGNFNADIVWVAGAFGGTNVVEKTEDAGTSFTVKDDGTFGSVTTFAIGPDSDERVLIIDSNEDIHETIDDGDTWTTHQTAVGLTTISVARLDKNVQEIVLGNEASANINIQYSVNTGANLQDYSDGFPEINVTGLEVG